MAHFVGSWGSKETGKSLSSQMPKWFCLHSMGKISLEIETRILVQKMKCALASEAMAKCASWSNSARLASRLTCYSQLFFWQSQPMSLVLLTQFMGLKTWIEVCDHLHFCNLSADWAAVSQPGMFRFDFTNIVVKQQGLIERSDTTQNLHKLPILDTGLATWLCMWLED